MDAEMRPDLRICLPPDQLHGSPRTQAVHAAQCRSLHHRTAVAELHLWLCPALDREAAETRLEAAVAALPELRVRHCHPALRQGRRWGDAIFVRLGGVSHGRGKIFSAFAPSQI